MNEDIIESIVEHLQGDGHVNAEYIRVEWGDGKPHLTGRVSSEEELQAVEEILNDMLELEAYQNDIWIDDTLAFDGQEEGAESDKEFEDEGDNLEEGFEEDPEEDED